MAALLAEPELHPLDEPREVRPGGPGGGGPGRQEPGGGGGGDGGGDGESSRGARRGGPSLGMVGMLAMLVSVTALFAALVIAFVARSHAPKYWQPLQLPWGMWPSTALILTSSVTLEAARRAWAGMRAPGYRRWLTGTFALGLGFMVSQGVALSQLASQGMYLRGNPHSSLFYIITGTHALHVFGGILGLYYLIYQAKRPRLPDGNALHVTSVYWHFIDVLWMGLFLVLLHWR